MNFQDSEAMRKSSIEKLKMEKKIEFSWFKPRAKLKSRK